MWYGLCRVCQATAELKPNSLAVLSIGPLGQECVGGCSLVGVLDVPRASPSDMQLPEQVGGAAGAGGGGEGSGEGRGGEGSGEAGAGGWGGGMHS